MKLALFSVIVTFLACSTQADTNIEIQSFNKAKKSLERLVYFDHRKTIYCDARFNEDKSTVLPEGFVTEKFKKRAKRIEWEHIVPAENFGRTFKEWREGHEECVDNKGKSFKGRKCASKLNKQYRYMQADMYNLFPAIGAVNAFRSNYNFVESIQDNEPFGSCNIAINDRKVEPPQSAKGRIARAYLYMHSTYSRYKMSKQQLRLMTAWDKMYPVSSWECKRYQRIKDIQKNENTIMAERCRANKGEKLTQVLDVH